MIIDLMIVDKIERGKQVGQRFSFLLNGTVFWSSVGIQKWKGEYKVFVDEVQEDRMTAEDYQRQEIITFAAIEDALQYIKDCTYTELDKLAPCKGQKIFNPQSG